jgi:hypothetical protein
MKKSTILIERNQEIRNRFLQLRGQRIKKAIALKMVVEKEKKN